MENSYYLSELSKCVRCGSCKVFCPTYDEDPSEVMGARGRLALLWGLSSGKLTASQILNDSIFSCTLCGMCSDLCPLGIDVREIIYHGRSLLAKTDKKRSYLRALTRLVTKSPKLSFRLLQMTQHFVLPYLLKKSILPFKLDIPEHHLKDNLHVFTVSKKRGRVAVFTGCIVNFFYPQLGESLINVLHKLGYEVILPMGETCCGVSLRTLGLEKAAIQLAKKNIEIFNRLNVEAVVSICPTCTLAIKVEYPKLVGKGIDNAMDISSFLIDKLDPSLFPPLPDQPGKAVYHDPCHLKYGLKIIKEPREIIRNIGIELLKTDGERCCGFAGMFSFSCKDLSQGLLNKCVIDYSKTGADKIITSCPGCMIQLTKGIEKLPVFHLIELIEDAMFPEPIDQLQSLEYSSR
jgi:glycolate oxidase iron-sulfur subunit